MNHTLSPSATGYREKNHGIVEISSVLTLCEDPSSLWGDGLHSSVTSHSLVIMSLIRAPLKGIQFPTQRLEGSLEASESVKQCKCKV